MPESRIFVKEMEVNELQHQNHFTKNITNLIKVKSKLQTIYIAVQWFE